MIKAEIVAHSSDNRGNELISVLCTFPRIILAEVNTHRMLSKNTSSSRAIPFFKMLQSIYDNPFIPIAWQTHHSGMQGSEYIGVNDVIFIPQFSEDFINIIRQQAINDKVKITKSFENALYHIKCSFEQVFQGDETHTVKTIWLKTRDIVAMCATMLYTGGKVSKQIANRLLEPFMWTTMLITGNRKNGGWDNFFELRCPRYEIQLESSKGLFKSKRDLLNAVHEAELDYYSKLDTVGWLKHNKGQAEIHIMDLAEKIYNEVNSSVPKILKEGEWHVPFNDVMDKYEGKPLYGPLIRVKASTAMAARTSYTIVGDEKKLDFEKLIELHDRLLNQSPPHSSPMEHCAQCMTEEVYRSNIKGKLDKIVTGNNFIPEDKSLGWSRNFRGFKQYREIIEEDRR